MSKLKVATIIGTRPEIIRLSRVMSVLTRNTDHVIIHTGQNYDYELNAIFLRISKFGNQISFLKLLERTLQKQ